MLVIMLTVMPVTLGTSSVVLAWALALGGDGAQVLGAVVGVGVGR